MAILKKTTRVDVGMISVYRSDIGLSNFAIRDLLFLFKLYLPPPKKGIISMSLVNKYFHVIADILKLKYEDSYQFPVPTSCRD